MASEYEVNKLTTDREILMEQLSAVRAERNTLAAQLADARRLIQVQIEAIDQGFYVGITNEVSCTECARSAVDCDAIVHTEECASGMLRNFLTAPAPRADLMQAQKALAEAYYWLKTARLSGSTYDQVVKLEMNLDDAYLAYRAAKEAAE